MPRFCNLSRMKWSIPIAALASLALTNSALGQAIIGESHVVIDKETPHPYSVATVRGEITWFTEIVHEGAGFIKVKFEDFSLAKGDYIIVRDPASNEVHRYDATSPEDFWAVSVFGERVIVELYSLADMGGHGFKIAGYGRGFRDPICSPPMCGVDVECTPPVGAPAYWLREPVCAIVYPGEPPGSMYMCSGYQIGYVPEDPPFPNWGYVLTNEHCEPPDGWWAAEAWFNSERIACGAGGLKDMHKYGLEELCSDAMKPGGLDYALLISEPAGAELTAPERWGKLPLRNGPPVQGESVYRFHHSDGCQKLYTDGTMISPAPNAPLMYWDYTAVGAPGSSGSPVIGALDVCVAAHHGYAGTGQGQGCVPGKGSEMQDIIAHIIANCPFGLPESVELCTAQEGPVSKKFCVSGNSTGVGWSWGIVVNQALVCSQVVDPLPPGRPCREFAGMFVATIRDQCEPLTGCRVENTGDRCCFKITCGENFQFFVGDEGGDPASGCEVTNNPGGCQFNPVIIEVPDVSVPTVSEWGLVVMALLLLTGIKSKFGRKRGHH